MDPIASTCSSTEPPTPVRRDTSLSLVIPAFDEEAVIGQAVAEAIAALEAITSDFEVIVVDDGSGDGTAVLVETLSRRDSRVRLIRQGENQGYGAALRAGFEAAQFELIAFTDADCQFHLEDLDYLVELAGRFDVVSGYRIDRKDSALRRFCSWVYNTLVQTLMGSPVRDIDCALKVFRRSALLRILPDTSEFFANTEMFAKAEQLKLRIVDVGVRHRPRVGGHSKVRLHDVPRTLDALLPYWWRVHFAGTATSSEPASEWRTIWICGLLLMLLSGSVLFTKLDYPLIEPDEGRYAEIMREMAVTGELLVPRLHHEAYLDKPPLFYWCGALSVAMFGPEEWAVRLVPAAAAWLTIVMTYVCGCRLVGVRSAFLGSLILTLSIGFTMCGRYLILDSLLTLFVAASLLIGVLALDVGRSRFLPCWLLSAVCCGLGMLTKGPVSVLLVVPPLFVYGWLTRSRLYQRWRPWMLFAGVVVAVNLPWYVAMIQRAPDFAEYFFWEHNVGRFLSGLNHPQPLWFYAPVLLLGCMPWGLLLFPLVSFLSSRTDERRRQRPAAIGFLLLSVIWCLGFFSISSSKLPTYIMPCFPAVGLLLGHYVHCTHSPFAVGKRMQHVHSLFGQGTVYVTMAGVVFALVMWQLGLESVWTALIHGSLWGLLTVSILMLRRQIAPRAIWATFCLVALAATWEASHRLIPAWANQHSIIQPDSPLEAEMEDPSESIACLQYAPGSIPFSLNRDDVVLLRFEEPREIAEFTADARGGFLVVAASVDESQLRYMFPADRTPQPVATGVTGSVFRIEPDETAAVVLHPMPPQEDGAIPMVRFDRRASTALR